MRRYLWLHEYNMTVTDVFSQINRPDLRTSMLASLKVDPTTMNGDFDAWVNFIQYGEICLSSHDRLKS